MKERKFQQPNKTNNSNIIQRLEGHEKNQYFFCSVFLGNDGFRGRTSYIKSVELKHESD
jgi:hypothetical protein